MHLKKRYRTSYVLTDAGYRALAEYRANDHHVRIGPVPCRGCRGLVEWRGPLGWCDNGPGTTHQCDAG